MKKLRLILCTVLLSSIFAGNIFASGTASVGGGVSGLFTALLTTVTQFLRSNDDNCRPRQCTTCKPDELDDDGNCRPPANAN